MELGMNKLLKYISNNFTQLYTGAGKEKMNLNYLRFNIIRQVKKQKIKYNKSIQPRIFIYQLPIYGNIGDQAIAYAMIEFLKRQFEEYEIIENRVSYPDFKNIENLSKRDKICLIGGGNFGDLYPYEMWYRNYVIKKHPNTQIIIFPVSIYYTNLGNNKYDNRYYTNRNIYLMVREQKSYQYAKNNFKCNCILVPDIVNYLSINFDTNKSSEEICVLKRNDIETEIEPEELINVLTSLGVNYSFEDNHVESRVYSSIEMEHLVLKQLKNISSYDLIITDRLHGMIFAYVTNTPAIVLPANIKIEESYKLWYSSIESIHYIDNIEKLDLNLINKMKVKQTNKLLYNEETIKELTEFIGKV